ncbi:MAG: four helix bundle protein [Eubacteriales bacterium]
MGRNAVEEKSFRFSIRVVRLYRMMTEQKKEYVLSKQLLRSGTSIGANVTEAEHGFSRKDFLAKMYIAYKECAETAYWLKLLYATDYLSEAEYHSICGDCMELKKMLSAITKTTREGDG